MRIEVEGKSAVTDPTEAQVRKSILGLRSSGPSSFASLTDDLGNYIQVGGGGVTCLLERRDAGTGRHFRAHHAAPSEVFADGTKLVFSAGEVPLAADEWFDSRSVLEAFLAFRTRSELPADILWREVTGSLSGGQGGDAPPNAAREAKSFSDNSVLGNWRRLVLGLTSALAFALVSSWSFMGWEEAIRPARQLQVALLSAAGAVLFLWATWEGWRADRKRRR
ncbi:hypothetical protein [Caulobacter sp. 17J65-9]|uniref:hypothetical protein n=1 Tax=Caulobacter sp. 17J65-9 TaxID=2709382 RepID=UPI001969BA67|nr:hypothetical protein [Caulobacter sp. 17J65-9]